MKQVVIVGIGMGNWKTLTMEAMETIKKANVVIGAKRMVESVEELAPTATQFYSYKSQEILTYVKETEYETYVVVMSGDTGFHSGTKELRKALLKEQITPVILPGISSVSYFFSKIGVSWEDACLVSMHGAEVDVVNLVRNNEKTFFLTAGNVSTILGTLVANGFGVAKCYVGENLSYEKERIISGSVEELAIQNFEKLSVILIINEQAKESVDTKDTLTIGIPDEEFLRGKVPMTKSEVRAVILSKLRLKKDTVAYDVGAGTGSVSIEMALNIGAGIVYAIETKEEAVALIKDNKEKFHADRLEIVEGLAPEALSALPCPTSVFIGGSKGNMEGIINTILDKLPEEDSENKIQFVISAIALETMAETISVFQELEMEDIDIAQIQVSKSKKVSKYNMMIGQNPIYIISGRKGRKSES